MIKLPPDDDIPLRGIMFLDGAKGYAAQGFVNDALGIHVTKERATRNDPFEMVITMDGVEGSFESMADLREAVVAINELNGVGP